MQFQVVAYVNKILSRCKANCDFTWSAGLTPVVSSISQNSGPAGTEVTLSGSGFSSTKADNIVKFGEDCEVTSASASQIKCKVGACVQTAI